MKAPQIIMIIMYVLALWVAFTEHGKSAGKRNFWVTLLSVAIEVALLKWGGFF